MENKLKEIAKLAAKLSPEEKQALADIFGVKNEVPKPVEKKEIKPEPAMAKRVFFFLQVQPLETQNIKVEKTESGEVLVKEVDIKPSRILAVDEKMAGKLFYKQRNKFRYLGTSPGLAWKKARNEGMKVWEAQEEEYKYLQEHPDLTPPRSNEKTFFSGTKLAQISRGVEMPWREGIRQKINE